MLTPDEKAICARLHISEAEYSAMGRSGIQRLLDGPQEIETSANPADKKEVRIGGFRQVG